MQVSNHLFLDTKKRPVTPLHHPTAIAVSRYACSLYKKWPQGRDCAIWLGRKERQGGMGNGEWGKRKPGFNLPHMILCALSCSSLRPLRHRSCLRPIRGSCGASGSLLGFNSVPKRTYHVLHLLRLLPAVGELVAVRCRAGAYQLQIAIRGRLNRQAAICGFPSPCDLRPSICFQCPRTDDTLTSRFKPKQDISSHAP